MPTWWRRAPGSQSRVTGSPARPAGTRCIDRTPDGDLERQTQPGAGGRGGGPVGPAAPWMSAAVRAPMRSGSPSAAGGWMPSTSPGRSRAGRGRTVPTQPRGQLGPRRPAHRSTGGRRVRPRQRPVHATAGAGAGGDVRRAGGCGAARWHAARSAHTIHQTWTPRSAGRMCRSMFFTAEDVVADLDDEQWEVLVAEARPRTATDGEGETVTVHDTVLRARRTS